MNNTTKRRVLLAAASTMAIAIAAAGPVAASSPGIHTVKITYDTLNGLSVVTPGGYNCAFSGGASGALVTCTIKSTFENVGTCQDPSVIANATGSAAPPATSATVDASTTCGGGPNAATAACAFTLGVLPSMNGCGQATKDSWGLSIACLVDAPSAVLLSYDATCSVDIQ